MRRFLALPALLAAAVIHLFAPAAHALPPEPRGVRLQVTPISDVNENDAAGYAVLEYWVVTVEGVVQLGSGAVDPLDIGDPTTWFYVSDATGGVAVTDTRGIFWEVDEGDRVQVTAMVETRLEAGVQGTRTLNFAGAGASAAIDVIGSGSAVPPVEITPAELIGNGSVYEGSRARINDLAFDPSGPAWPGTGASAFVQLTDGSSVIRLFIDGDSPLAGGVPPTGVFDVVGFVAQNDPASPYFQDHYLYPATAADIILTAGSGIVTVSPTVVVQSTSGVALAFELTGQEDELDRLEIGIPPEWDWEAPGDVMLTGPGFTGPGASASYRYEVDRYFVEVSGAAVTAAATGTLEIRSLRSPDAIGLYTFTARTASSGGDLAAITNSPTVRVGTSPGAVVINEVYPNTGHSYEGAEFIELKNKLDRDLNLEGWSLADIGRDGGCTLGPRWRFPAGTTLPANGFLVVCRTAFHPLGPDPNDDFGFFVDFPEAVLPPALLADSLLFEMVDASVSVERNDPRARDLVLGSPTSGDDQITLLGGTATNAGQCASPFAPGKLLPFSELVVLRDAGGLLMDLVEYREPGPCDEDYCDDGFTGPDDAYPYGVPQAHNSLGRDAASTDTDISRLDWIPSSQPTPGAENVPGDTVPPALVQGTGTPAALSASVVSIEFDEVVQTETALSAANYWLADTLTADTVATVTDVFEDGERPGRAFFLVTERLPAGQTLGLFVRGVADLEVGGGGGNPCTTSVPVGVPAKARTICEIQEFDENGFSPLVGDTVFVAGFVTIGSLPAVADPSDPNATAPSDRIGIWVQEPGGCGVNVYSFLSTDPLEYATYFADVREYGIQLNDFVQICGRVTEYVSSTSGSGAVTEVAGIESPADPAYNLYRFLLRGLDGPEPIVVATGEAGDEALEGTLVQTEGTMTVGDDIGFYLDDGTGSIQVFQNFDPQLDLTLYTVGDRLRVTGVITQYDSSLPYFSGYELVPQNQASIVKLLDYGFADAGPRVSVQRRVLVPELGESIEIETNTPHRSEAILEIYDAVGRKIRTLYDGLGLGEVTFTWNGEGDDGRVVEPGVYYCHLRTVALDGGPVRTKAAPIVVGLRLEGGGGVR
jgi:hypothetical protein